MKKLILFLALLVIPVWGANDTTHTLLPKIASQPIDMGAGIFWVDSLWNAPYVLPEDTTVSGTDTTFHLDTLTAQASVELTLNFAYDFLTVIVIDTGSVYTDSCSAQFASYEFTRSGSSTTPKYNTTTTHWNAINFMKDSTWSDGNFVPSAGKVQTYTMYVGNLKKIRFLMTNTGGGIVENKIWKFIVQASKKK